MKNPKSPRDPSPVRRVVMPVMAPVAGSPQSLAFCRSVRWRQVTPPSQVLEQPWTFATDVQRTYNGAKKKGGKRRLNWENTGKT